jgi:hypothetical protein
MIHAKNGSVKISDELTQRVSMHNEERHIHWYFVGDISSYGNNEAEWLGDKLNVDAYNGRVKIYTIDMAGNRKSKGGFFSRILGIS